MKTFGEAGAAFLEFRAKGKAARTADKHAWLHGKLRALHGRPLAEIKAPEILKVLRSFEGKGNNESARRAGQFTARVFRYAIGEGWCENNPARDLRGNLEPVVTTSHAGFTDPLKFGRLMQMIDTPGYSHPTVHHGLRLLARVALRPGELRQMLWDEVDFEKAEIRVPAARMKMRRPHLVPLAPVSIAILRHQHEVSGRQPYVFPGIRKGRPMSDAAMGVSLKNMFISPAEHVPHGFRTSFSTLLNEAGFDPAVIELQLSHAKKDKIAGIYDRSQRVPERVAMMVRWAEMIEEMKLEAALDIR